MRSDESPERDSRLPTHSLASGGRRRPSGAARSDAAAGGDGVSRMPHGRRRVARDRALSVRGAPAIGVAAAYGVCLGVQCRDASVDEVCDYLATSRPTAVNLFWALDRMRRVGEPRHQSIAVARSSTARTASAEARAIHDEDRQQCAAMGRHGADLLADLPDGAGILTHCNAGALPPAATARRWP